MQPAGPAWCDRFPGSNLLGDLAMPFREGAARFIAAIREAPVARVIVTATYRPPERAYLMHNCCMIASGQDPAAVARMPGVDIDWTCDGDIKAAKAAAAAMKARYGIAYPAALVSRHTQRLAVDMTISFYGAINVKNADGEISRVVTQRDLWPIGKSYGVIKLEGDAPHWSSDGH